MEPEAITREEFDRRLEQSTEHMRQKSTLLEVRAAELEDLISRYSAMLERTKNGDKSAAVSEPNQRFATTRFYRDSLYDPSFDPNDIKALIDALGKSGFYTAAAAGLDAERQIQATYKHGDVYYYPQREVRIDSEDIYEGSVEELAEEVNERVSSSQVNSKLKFTYRDRRCYGYLGDQEVFIFDYDEVKDLYDKWGYATKKIVNFINLSLEYNGSIYRLFYDGSEMGILLTEEEAAVLQAYHYMPAPTEE